MEKKFSKGKWFIGNSCSDSIRIATENYDVVADVYDGWNCVDKEIDMDVCVANAKLIAAAPDLLEALIKMCDFHEKNATWDKGNNGYYQAKNIIKKATE